MCECVCECVCVPSTYNMHRVCTFYNYIHGVRANGARVYVSCECVTLA